MLSKYAWVVLLKSKGGNEMASAITQIVRESRRCPINLQTDMGKEFYNADEQKNLKKHDVNHYSTYSRQRFNRTLKNDMWKLFTTLEHSVQRDKDRGFGKIQSRRFSTRVSQYKTVFEKGYTPNGTTEVSTIKVQRIYPVTYLLEKYRREFITGEFYEHELYRATHPDVYLMKKVLCRKRNKTNFEARYEKLIDEFSAELKTHEYLIADFPMMVETVYYSAPD
ncbi:PREDICTED: uncharacterized protein LOC105148624 [Acromyrmex echinatior]|uniref:uncharacterized protein LOC105148624 n=1 Tax=Acromyrmex echinatior TaxID=103372 RepID=UPI0005810669|nr:PREDICTED: uncharacterized protein LOC105148624 [Acromyrmex echinatior]